MRLMLHVLCQNTAISEPEHTILRHQVIRKCSYLLFFGNNANSPKNADFCLVELERNKIDKLIRTHKLPFQNADDLMQYVSSSIRNREQAKFEFTKIISLMFEGFPEICEELKISVDDASHLPIDFFLRFKSESRDISKTDLMRLIDQKNSALNSIHSSNFRSCYWTLTMRL